MNFSAAPPSCFFAPGLALGETVLYASRMAFSHDFTTTLATIAAKAVHTADDLSPEDAVEFAWFSVDSVGDASIDDADFIRHYVEWARLTGRA
jgi:hypothetical protein